MLSSTSGLVLLSLTSSVLAKTDLGGCTSTRAATGIIYYVPGSGEICSPLDCGGGRAPPKTDVPGCAAYEGSAPYAPSFLPGFGIGGTVTAPSEPAPTSGGLLTDTSVLTPPAAASSALVPVASVTSTALADTTTTLQNSAAATSLLTSELLFDTSAATRDVTNVIIVTSASAGPATATANAAAGAICGGKLVGAFVGAAAGFAMI